MGSSIIVRRATSLDTGKMSRMLNMSLARRENYLSEALTARFLAAKQIDHRLDEGPIWVAEAEGEIIGSISIKSEPNGLHIRSLAIRNDVEEQAVAPELLRAVSEFADVGELEARLIGDFYTQLVRAADHGRL
jgi:N-acetylglutamate synthase-like GNAT family acetyltransferase